MSFSMLFCIVFTMGAVFFDCKWEKVPNLWIIAGLQISMAEHLSGEVIQGLGSAVIRFWGGIFMVIFLFFPLFFFQLKPPSTLSSTPSLGGCRIQSFMESE